MEIVNKEISLTDELARFTLKTSAPYDAVFGIAGGTKTGSEISGDSHAFVKVAQGKFLFSLCDGMGSGDKANAISEEVSNLVEVFYRAGFETNLILQSINSLLLFESKDEFSAMDLCFLDLFSANAKFFKIASPECYIKGKSGIEVIDGKALPIGVLENFEPTIINKQLSNGDIIILTTDGVRDVFGGLDEILMYLNQIESTNPQVVADKIFEIVQEKNGGVLNDDATIMCIRIFNKV